jgi:hypothetical protein
MLVATVAIDPPIAAALGAIFTLFMARSIAAGGPLRRSVLTGAFVGAWLAASFGLHAVKYPAWMLCYAIDPRELPTAIWYPIFFALLLVCGALGGYFAHRMIAAGNKRGALVLATALIGVWIALFGLTLERYLVIGSFADYQAGRALPLSQQPAVMHDFNLITVVTAIGLLAALAATLLGERKKRAALG